MLETLEKRRQEERDREMGREMEKQRGKYGYEYHGSSFQRALFVEVLNFEDVLFLNISCQLCVACTKTTSVTLKR